MTEDEWVAIWMLGVIKKRKRLDKFVHQSVRDIVKAGGDNVVKNFEENSKNSELNAIEKRQILLQ